MRVTLLLVCLAAFGATAFAQTERPSFEELVRQFGYEHELSFYMREVGLKRRDGVMVVDLSYASPRGGGLVPAYLVVPEGKGPFAAILFGHWMMPGSPLKNRREFLEEQSSSPTRARSVCS